MEALQALAISLSSCIRLGRKNGIYTTGSPFGLPDSKLTQLDRQLVKDRKVNKPLSELSTTKRKEAVDMLRELHLFYLRPPMYASVWQR